VPYSLFSAGKADVRERRHYLAAVLADTRRLSAAVALMFVVGASTLAIFGWLQAAAVSAVLAVAMPCILLREFARRVVYADFRPLAALAISSAVSILQLGFMAGLYWANRVTAATTFAAMGASSLIGGGAWLCANRASLKFAGRSGDWLREHWLLGRWLLAGQASEVLRIQMLPWLLAMAADQTTVGIYAACAFVAALPTPLQVGISHLIVPQLAHVDRRGGLVATDRLVRQASLWLSAAMIAYAAAVYMVSERVVPWIYGDQFHNTQHCLMVLVMSWAIAGTALPVARALLVLKLPDRGFWANLAGIIANLALGMPFVMRWGATGAAYSALIGSVLAAGLACAWYVIEVRRRFGNGSAPSSFGSALPAAALQLAESATRATLAEEKR
jgi:O-antigen/teichoic acid export membrane protein